MKKTPNEMQPGVAPAAETNAPDLTVKTKLCRLTLYGTEEVEVLSEVLIEVPEDVSEEELQALGGEGLEGLISEAEIDMEWQQDDINDRSVHDHVTVEDVDDEMYSADARFQRDEDGKLVVVAPE